MNVKELCKLLREANSVYEIDSKREEIAELIPQIRVMFEYDQKNYAHQYDLWMHSLHTVMGIGREAEDNLVYLAALLHDIGKPDCQCDSKSGEGKSYYGHPERSYEIVRDEVLPEIGEQLSDVEKDRLLYYVRYHDDHVSLRIKHLRRHLRMGASLEEFKTLMLLQVADAKAHIQVPVVKERLEICGQLAGEYSDSLYRAIMEGSEWTNEKE